MYQSMLKYILSPETEAGKALARLQGLRGDVFIGENADPGGDGHSPAGDLFRRQVEGEERPQGAARLRHQNP